MPTIFTCLQSFCTATKKNMLQPHERRYLGKIIIRHWMENRIKCTLHRVTSYEPEGTTTALSYPRFFKPIINQFIIDFYKKLNKPYNNPSDTLSKAYEPLDNPSQPLF